MHSASEISKIQTKEINIYHEFACVAPAEDPYTCFIFAYISPLIIFTKHASYCTVFKNSISI